MYMRRLKIHKIEIGLINKMSNYTIDINARIYGTIGTINVCNCKPKNLKLDAEIYMDDSRKSYISVTLRNERGQNKNTSLHKFEIPSWTHELIIVEDLSPTSEIFGQGIYKTYIITMDDDNTYGFIIVGRDDFVDNIIIINRRQ